MKLAVMYLPSLPASASPYRLRDQKGRELDWANVFLDAQRLRQLSLHSLRAYAFDLLDFARHAESRIMPNPFQIQRLEGLGPYSDSA
jgi:hypothetical protein